jgi:hypothetical protein
MTTIYDLEQVINERHSTQVYFPRVVPTEESDRFNHQGDSSGGS